MSPRYTIQDLQSWVSDKGGKCLSKEYLGAQTKLTWMCPRGHTWDAVPHTVKKGSWCPTCSGKRKGTIEQMQELATERGGKCLSKEYINKDSKLKWQCEEGHIWKSVPYPVRSGSWCPYCYGNAKHTIQEMQKIAKKRGGKCLSKKYINKESKLKWQCAKRHTWFARPGTIVHQKSWCPVCARKKMGNKGISIHTIEEMHRIAKERKGKCLSKKYINVDALLKWQCARGHIWKARPYTILKRSSWCRKCRDIDRRTKYKYHRK